jgi:benzoate-CoA ligase
MSQVNKIQLPRNFNAAVDLITPNLVAGRGNKAAFIDDSCSLTYQELDLRTNAFGNVLKTLGLQPEQRILLCLHDTIDWPTSFLGAIKAGIVPIPVNTLLTGADYEYMLTDSRAKIAVVSAALLPLFAPLLGKVPTLEKIIVSGETELSNKSIFAFEALISAEKTELTPCNTTIDDPCFWLYSSGSTGSPKGTVHVHSSMRYTSELYAKPILEIKDSDVVFSAAKLFFAYGLGNGLTFPLSVGATAILMAERPTPDSVSKNLLKHQPTIFYGVPTLYASMLASPNLPKKEEMRFTRCTSAGEALPEEIGKRWQAHFGVDILDGIGSTEMLHIFLSNRIGDVKYGTTGLPVPGYEVKLVNELGELVSPGESGELHISGPSSASLYWNNRPKSIDTFQGKWTRSGDKYFQDENGYYVYAGRSDDMLKVSGIYVSPIEVESTLITHPSVLEAAVVGREDDDKLTKPAAFIVLKPGISHTPELADELKAHVKKLLAPYKYPRWFEFVEELPKTATGKIQRFKLRTLTTNKH